MDSVVGRKDVKKRVRRVQSWANVLAGIEQPGKKRKISEASPKNEDAEVGDDASDG